MKENINKIIKVMKNYFYSVVSGKFKKTKNAGSETNSSQQEKDGKEKKQPNWFLVEIKERLNYKIFKIRKEIFIMTAAFDTQSYVDKNWKLFYISLAFIATTMGVIGSDRENYQNFYGLILIALPTINLLLCENFRTRGVEKYNNFRKNLLKYMSENMTEEDIVRYVKARPLIKALFEEAKSDKDFNWETIEDKLSDEAYALLYPKYKQFYKEQNKKIKSIKKESLREPFSGEDFEKTRVYVDIVVDKSRYVLLIIWFILFAIYITGCNDYICSL